MRPTWGSRAAPSSPPSRSIIRSSCAKPSARLSAKARELSGSAGSEELHNQGTVQTTPQTIAQGVRETHWPGRFQVVPAVGDNPEYVLDVAHNPAGAWALRSTLSAAYQNNREITMVFGVMRDKAVQEITEILFPIAEHVIVTRANNPRSASPDEIRQAAAPVAAGSYILYVWR